MQSLPRALSPYLLLQVEWVGSSTLVESCLVPATSTWTTPCSLLAMEQTKARIIGSFATVGVAGESEATFVSDVTGKGRSHVEQIALLKMGMLAKVTQSLASTAVSVASFHPQVTPPVSRKPIAIFKSEVVLTDSKVSDEL